MATLNPLEQKARSSFIKGMLITALIAVVIIGILAMFIFKMRGEEKERLDAQKEVLVLKQNVVSGQGVDSSMFVKKKIDGDFVPTGAVDAFNAFQSLSLADVDGNQITRETNGDGTSTQEILHITSEDNPNTTEVDEGSHQLFTDSNGNYYYEVDADGNRITTLIDETRTNANQNSQTKYIHVAARDNTSTADEEGIYKLNKKSDGTLFYNDTANNNTEVAVTIQYKYVTLGETSFVAKISLNKNTVLTPSMLIASNERTTKDLRQEEYNMIVLPSTLVTDDTVDIRLRLPTGQDYIVISKKKITIPQIGEGLSASTILMNLNEGELLTMSSAIVDAYELTGSKLYAVKYVEPGLQDNATVTYTPSQRTIEQIESDPNIVATAKAELYKYYGSNYQGIRGRIDEAVNTIDKETRKSNVESKTASEASTERTERQQYLEAISGQ